MPRRYFEKFPQINYNGYNVRDLTVAAKLMNKYASFPYVYDPYVIDREQRADQVAAQVYDDPAMTWMLWYANGMQDPYYDWYLPEQQFNDFLIKKYGSVEVTHKRILGFRTNWYETDQELSPAEFQNRFGEFKAPHSFYWNPVYDEESNSRILYYIRRIRDNIVNTNKIVKVLVDDDVFETEDLIDIKTGGSNVGTAEVLTVDDGVVFLKNVIGSIGEGYSLVLDQVSSTNCLITEYSSNFDATANTWTRTNITEEEYVYWSPFTVNDVESEANEARKTIKVVDGELAIRVADRLEEELQGRT